MTDVNNDNPARVHTDTWSLGIATSQHLTPEGLLLYLQTRLGNIDSQIEELFEKQERLAELQDKLGLLMNMTAGSKEGEPLKLTEAQVQELVGLINDINALDPALASSIVTQLEGGDFALNHDGTQYSFAQHVNDDGVVVLSSQDVSMFDSVLGHASGQLDSSAQLEMLQLQQLMSERQTCVQLATNLMAALGKADEAIVSNIR